MATTTSVENVFIKNKNLADHPQLAAMVDLYSAALVGGYDPDPELLTDMFSVLCEVLVDDPTLAAAIDLLEVAIIEEVLVRGTDLANNASILGMLTVYLGALQNGYVPDTEVQATTYSALADIETTDPALSGLISSVVAFVGPPATFGSLLNGGTQDDWLGFSVSAAGDVNGDGIDDVIIGARYGNGGTGEAYVVFGALAGLPATLELSALNGSDGFAILGISSGDQAGYSVSNLSRRTCRTGGRRERHNLLYCGKTCTPLDSDS